VCSTWWMARALDTYSRSQPSPVPCTTARHCTPRESANWRMRPHVSATEAGRTLNFAIAAGSAEDQSSSRACHTASLVAVSVAGAPSFRNVSAWAASPASVPSKRMSRSGAAPAVNRVWRRGRFVYRLRRYHPALISLADCVKRILLQTLFD
jgi:hypothetical protein